MHIRNLMPALSVGLLAACAPLSPNLDAQFGEAVNMAKARQTIDAEASRNTEPVAIDGKAAEKAVEKYDKSFGTSAPAAAATIINIGNGK